MPIITPEDKPVVSLLCGHVVQNGGIVSRYGDVVSTSIGVVGEAIWVKYALAAPEKSPALYPSGALLILVRYL
jgi:hypothetical protein